MNFELARFNMISNRYAHGICLMKKVLGLLGTIKREGIWSAHRYVI